jgi:magnesium-transporting ATPase (P-type)
MNENETLDISIEIMVQLIMIGVSIVLMIVVECIQEKREIKRNKQLKDFSQHNMKRLSNEEPKSGSGLSFNYFSGIRSGDS